MADVVLSASLESRTVIVLFNVCVVRASLYLHETNATHIGKAITDQQELGIV
jgi:hypothetical protein